MVCLMAPLSITLSYLGGQGHSSCLKSCLDLMLWTIQYVSQNSIFTNESESICDLVYFNRGIKTEGLM